MPQSSNHRHQHRRLRQPGVHLPRHSAFTGAGQLRLASSGTDTIIQANTGGSFSPEMEIAVTDGSTLPEAWSARDFLT